MVEIGVVALGETGIYLVGVVRVTRKGDAYNVVLFRHGEHHTSRHADGKRHTKTRISNKKKPLCYNLKKSVPIENFQGIEFLGTHCFGLDSLPSLFENYELKKEYDGIFAIDMRRYRNYAFNLHVALLTEESLPKLLKNPLRAEKRQIYVYPDSRPMIAIFVNSFRPTDKKSPIKRV